MLSICQVLGLSSLHILTYLIWQPFAIGTVIIFILQMNKILINGIPVIQPLRIMLQKHIYYWGRVVQMCLWVEKQTISLPIECCHLVTRKTVNTSIVTGRSLGVYQNVKTRGFFSNSILGNFILFFLCLVFLFLFSLQTLEAISSRWNQHNMRRQ